MVGELIGLASGRFLDLAKDGDAVAHMAPADIL